MPQETIDILITCYFRKHFTQKVLDYLIERTKHPFRIIIVDNGSTDGTREMVQEYQTKYPGIFKKVILLPSNIGLQASKMVGMDFVESEYFVNTDNDVLPPLLDPDWLSQQLDLIKRHPEYAAIACRPQKMIGVGPIFKEAKEVVSNNMAGGHLRIMNTKAVRDVGGWLTTFENRAEEREICGKLIRAGFKIGFATNIRCYHLFGDEEDKKTQGQPNWGYPADVPHYHREGARIYATDDEVDPLTFEPKIKYNE